MPHLPARAVAVIGSYSCLGGDEETIIVCIAFLCVQDFVAAPSLEDIVHYDQWARQYVKKFVESGKLQPTLA